LLVLAPPVGLNLAEHTVRLLDLNETLVGLVPQALILDLVGMVLLGELPVRSCDLRLRGGGTHAQHLIRVPFAIYVHAFEHLLPGLVPAVVLRIVIGVLQGLLQIRPPGGGQEIMDGLVDGHFAAVLVRNGAIEVQEAAPEGAIDDNGGGQLEGPLSGASTSRWCPTPLLGQAIKGQCRHQSSEQQGVGLVVYQIPGRIRQIGGQKAVPPHALLPTNVAHQPNAQGYKERYGPVQEAEVQTADQRLRDGHGAHLTEQVTDHHLAHESLRGVCWFWIRLQLGHKHLDESRILVGIPHIFGDQEELAHPSDAHVAAQGAPPNEGVAIAMQVQMMQSEDPAEKPAQIGNHHRFLGRENIHLLVFTLALDQAAIGLQFRG